jgi:hypothetical protein
MKPDSISGFPEEPLLVDREPGFGIISPEQVNNRQQPEQFIGCLVGGVPIDEDLVLIPDGDLFLVNVYSHMLSFNELL